ncbi:hypothetical protein [Streptomyces sp. NBC_01579]|uniref:hypothetical protein n=1 Tax=Streptomyces sp. NBC_01579 TaxID=2975885 RepID=UPI0038687C22
MRQPQVDTDPTGDLGQHLFRACLNPLRNIVQPLDLEILKRPDAVPYGDPPHRWWRSAF